MNSIMSSVASDANSNDMKSNPDQPSNTDLMSNAKLVAEADKYVATNQTEKIDKPKVADATADLLDSVKQYGKFDESQGVGQYIKQGEDYLHQYEKSSGASTTPRVEGPPATEEKKIETTASKEDYKYEEPAPVEEKKIEVLTPTVEKKHEEPAPDVEKKVEVSTPTEEKKVKVPTPADEKKDEARAPDEEKGGLGTEEDIKAAESF